MLEKTKGVLDIISNHENNSIFHLDDLENPNDPNSKSVRDILISKHPTGQKPYRECIIEEEPQDPHQIIFEAINSNSIRSNALKIRGAAGPSGLDAHIWRRQCTSYKGPSSDLCEALATVAKRICSIYVDPNSLKPLLACLLIALSKKPGVRPNRDRGHGTKDNGKVHNSASEKRYPAGRPVDANSCVEGSYQESKQQYTPQKPLSK